MFPGDQFRRSGVRLNPDGSRDFGFANVAAMGGKLVLWNDRFYTINGYGIRRFWHDGTLDTTFDNAHAPYILNTTVDYWVYPDGSVITVGAHTLWDTIHGFTGDHVVAWLTNTGQLDSTRLHRKGNGVAQTIARQDDGKFLISGVQTIYDGQAVGRIYRIHPDGDLDTTFTTSLHWGAAIAMTPLQDGRIIASGHFQFLGSTDTLNLIRLLPDGSLDPTFHNTTYFNDDFLGRINGLGHTVLTDGTILAYTDFDHVDGWPRKGIVQLESTGNLINSGFQGSGCGDYFNGTYLSHAVDGIVPCPTGGYYIHGSYDGYDDGSMNHTSQRMISRLYGLDVGVQEQGARAAATLNAYPSPASTWVTMAYHLSGPTNNATLEVLDMTGRVVHRAGISSSEGQYVWDCRQVQPGAYVVRMINGGALVGAQRIVVQP